MYMKIKVSFTHFVFGSGSEPIIQIGIQIRQKASDTFESASKTLPENVRLGSWYPFSKP